MKKGFTLIELLSTIVILGLIFSISVYEVIKLERSSKQKLYNEQIDRIEDTARLWAIENMGLLEGKTSYQLELNTLVESNLLSSNDLYSPVDKSLLKGCILITYTTVYNYTYDEDCE